MDNFGIRIESPGFPKEYLINEDCSYFIRLTHSDICFLQVDFTKFSVGNLLGFCSGDYVLINGEGICGNLTGKMNHVVYYYVQWRQSSRCNGTHGFLPRPENPGQTLPLFSSIVEVVTYLI